MTPRPDHDPSHDDCIRSAMYAPTALACRDAARTLRRVASIRPEGGELRALYLRAAYLMEYEADNISRVSSSRRAV